MPVRTEMSFDEKINQLSDLYEEGKDCLHQTFKEDPAHRRMYEILKSMRDIAVAALQNSNCGNTCQGGFRYGGSGLSAGE